VNYQIILSAQTERKLCSLCERINAGNAAPGRRSASQHKDTSKELDWRILLDVLLNSKKPCIFAESEVAGDGSDWTLEELQILGDISVAADVTVFDDGEHHQPVIHKPPFDATLVFTPGALLRNDRGNTPADSDELVREGSIDPECFFSLYERRLLPIFRFINTCAAERGRRALVTVPGLGCGQFAGRFRGTLGILLSDTLERLLREQVSALDHVRVVRFDPFDECEDRSVQLHDLSFRVRPLSRSRHPRPQLCRPIDYQEAGDDFSGCDLFGIVAWDHVSWPGNDFYRGTRATDDGVKAAATSVMQAITGVRGQYDEAWHCYGPPRAYRDWEEVVRRNEVRLHTGRVFVV